MGMMKMKMMMWLAVAMAMMIGRRGALAEVYTVGDSSGWGMATDYSTWASDKTFNVGDSLVFKYPSGHTVDEVSADDYKNCATGNSISSDSSGATTLTLKTAGAHYFICGIPGHCSGGMKLAVNVKAASSSTGAGAAAAPPTAGGEAPPSDTTGTDTTAATSPPSDTPTATETPAVGRAVPSGRTDSTKTSAESAAAVAAPPYVAAVIAVAYVAGFKWLAV
ncbi:blue copper protein-like [Andrographis paniculata]|uniref:blue copper protein-like n=1 Tax=Andrographis paniculata TaxID=175694 RepID=UPI0021E7D3CA|nr:blue copper protein-like [Andrographis paniculata]